jgi:LAS superfamily LD-carboxypeptidase LdcB
MHEAAKKDNVDLKIVSGVRSFDRQKEIWEGKWEQFSTTVNKKDRALKILEFNAMPMTSRHHWGTDIDINSVVPNDWKTGGKYENVYNWLKTNAKKFNFVQTYTDKTQTNRTGYMEERWHWSYMPVAQKYLKLYNENIKSSDIKGFSGDDQVINIPIIKEYVNGISKQ